MIQKITSANTSINCTKLPAIYNKIDFSNFIPGFYLLDYGCGKYNNAKDYIYSSEIKGNWFGYDPFNRSEEENKRSYYRHYECIVCSNVLNVISDINILFETIKKIIDRADNDTKIFITIYEGDKTGVGKITKKDCYQRNEIISKYLEYCNIVSSKKNFVIKKGVITNCPEYIK